MEAVQFFEKFNEEVIGTILITEKNTREDIISAWEQYHELENSNRERYANIWSFVNMFPKMDMEVINVEPCNY